MNDGLWEPEEVPPRKKLISFIIRRVKEGASKEQLLDIEVPEFLDSNGLPLFPRWDVENMIDWAMRKFPVKSK
jgi:hypothetical protein